MNGTDGQNVSRGATAWSAALQVLGATAGLSALAAFVGGTTLWIRFDALRLPADQAVAQLPERLLLIIGVHAIAASVILGALVAVLLVLVPMKADRTPKFVFWVVLTVITFIGLMFVVAALWNVEDVALMLVVLGIVALGLAAIGIGARSPRTGRRHIGLIVFAVFSICGAAIAIVRTEARPRLEPAAVLFKDGRPGLAGFYVGQSGDRLYLATLPGDGTPTDPFADAAIEHVVEIPRDEVLRVAIRRPTGLRTTDRGRDQAQTLLADLQAQQLTIGQRVAERPVGSEHPVVDFAPLAHLHSSEKFWPMSVKEFLDNSVLLWAHDKRCDWSFGARGHVRRREGAAPAARGDIDPARLGRGSAAYAHPRSAGHCVDAAGVSFDATQITRPFESEGRASGVPEREGFYLNVANAARNGKQRKEKQGGQEFVDRVPVYYERHGDTRDPGRERITYWFFYGLSRPPGPEMLLNQFVHEGDWERISVLLEPRPGHRYAPISVRYHFHEESRDVPWYAVRKVAAEDGGTPTHPVVYIAKASHASYPRAGEYEEERRILGGRRVTARDDAIACSQCPQWRTWERLESATRAPWYGFGGAWGNIGPDAGRTGPLGPSPRKTCRMQKCPTVQADRA
jgi:hypothetical protein